MNKKKIKMIDKEHLDLFNSMCIILNIYKIEKKIK